MQGYVVDDAYERILAEVIEAAEQGREPVLDEVASRHPGHEQSVRDVLEAFGTYSRMRTEAVRPLAPNALAPGERLGDFEIVGPLAHGGMGVVYRARQSTLGGRVVALKVLPGDTASERGVARFQREARTLAGLHHPHLAEVYGFGGDRGTLFYAMRLVEGPTLRDVLQRRAAARRTDKPDSPDQRRALVARMVEVADALAVVHAAGAVHRDVKPANIVLEGGTPENALDHAAVLVDFGLVRAADTSTITQTGESPGTPSYAPPEQLLGREVDARADVFSLGVTLHDLLARREPHERAQASAGLEPLHEIDPEIDADLSAVVAKAADPEARWRYPEAAVLRDDLVAWLHHCVVSARRPPWRERLQRWTQSAAGQRTMSTTIRFGVAAVLVLTLFYYVSAAAVSVKALRKSFQEKDWRSMLEEATRVPAIVPSWILGDPVLEDLVQRLRSNRTDDSLTDIQSWLQQDRPQEALLAAHARIERLGFQGDATLTRFLQHSIERPPRDNPTRPLNLFAISRLMVAKPICDDAESQAAEGIRTALHHLLFDQSNRALDLSDQERLEALSALSGCGTLSDARRLAADIRLSFERGQIDEATRLGLFTVAQIILRSAPVRPDNEEDLVALDGDLCAIADRFLPDHPEDTSHLIYRTRVAIEECLRTVGYQRRSMGHRLDFTFHEGFLRTNPNEDPRVQMSWLKVMASRGDLRALTLLSDGYARSANRIRNEPLGIEHAFSKYCQDVKWLCQALGSGEWTDQGLSLCRSVAKDLNHPWTAAAEAEFHSGGDAVTQTSLERVHHSDHRSVVAVKSPLTHGTLHLVHHYPNQAGFSFEPSNRGVVASWDFTGKEGIRQGSAMADVTTTDADKGLDNEGYLRMYQPGHSQVSLRFTLPEDLIGESVSIVPTAQIESVDVLPFQGRVELEIQFDQENVGTCVVPESNPLAVGRIVTRRLAITKGEHSIKVQLGSGSSTACRLHRVVVAKSAVVASFTPARTILDQYATRGEGIERAEVLLEKSWFKDVGPPFHGTDIVYAVFDELGMRTISWSWVSTRDPLLNNIQTHSLDVPTGQRCLGEVFRVLRQGGWCELEEPPKPKADMFLSAENYRVRVDVSGRVGVAELRAYLPDGFNWDPEYTGAAECFSRAAKLLRGP